MNLHKQQANWTIEWVVCRLQNVQYYGKTRTTTKHKYIPYICMCCVQCNDVHCMFFTCSVHVRYIHKHIHGMYIQRIQSQLGFFRWMTTKRQSVPIYLGQIPGIESISYPLFSYLLHNNIPYLFVCGNRLPFLVHRFRLEWHIWFRFCVFFYLQSTTILYTHIKCYLGWGRDDYMQWDKYDATQTHTNILNCMLLFD